MLFMLRFVTMETFQNKQKKEHKSEIEKLNGITCKVKE